MRGRRGWRLGRSVNVAGAGAADLLSSPIEYSIHATEAGGATAAGAAAAAAPGAVAPPVSTSVATLLTRHILRDGEIILLVLKPSLWTIVFSSLPALAAALIVMLSTRLWAPHHVHIAVEAGLMLIACQLGWAVLRWSGRLYLLTDQRIVRISGVFNPQIHDIPLRKVARTRMMTSLHERICRLGSIEIIPESDHWPWSIWQSVPRPHEVHEMIRRAIGRAKQGGGYGLGL